MLEKTLGRWFNQGIASLIRLLLVFIQRECTFRRNRDFVFSNANRVPKQYVCLFQQSRKRKAMAPVITFIIEPVKSCSREYGCRQHPTWQSRQEIDELSEGKKRCGMQHSQATLKGFGRERNVDAATEGWMKIRRLSGFIKRKFVAGAIQGRRSTSKHCEDVGRNRSAIHPLVEFINRASDKQFSSVEPPSRANPPRRNHYLIAGPQ